MLLLKKLLEIWLVHKEKTKMAREKVENLQYTDTMTSEEYNELRMCVGWRPITEGQAKRGLEHTTFLMAARDRGKIVAMGRMLFDFGYTAYLGDVIVRPEYQGQGIGRQ